MERWSSLNRSAGSVVIDGREVGELRQCSHCQYTWVYRAGSGAKRGVCLKCMGLVCGKPECMAGCAPLKAIFEEGDMSYRMNEAGVMVKEKS